MLSYALYIADIGSTASVEKREKELKKNLETVNKDKQKIEVTIDQLDQYKRDALQKTWNKVTVWVPYFYPSCSLVLISQLLVTSARSLATYSLEILLNWNLQRARTSWMVWRSKCGSGPCGNTA